MSSEFDFEISSSESEIDDFEFEDKQEISKLCVLLNVSGTVKAIVDIMDCIQKNNTKCLLYILENGSCEIYRKYIEDNILKQKYSCVSVRYHFEEKGINVDEMFQKGVDLIANDNINRIIFSHNYELSKNINEIINQTPIPFQNTFRQNVLFKIENTRSETKIETKNEKSLPLENTPQNKPSNKNFVQLLKERKRNRNVEPKTFQQNKNEFRNMFEKEEKIKNEDKIFVMLPTYNRGTKCIKVIDEIRSQNISNWFLYVVDDGSDMSHSNKLRNHVNRLNDPRIEFDVNQQNMRLPKTLNRGLRKFLKSACNYFTWISDDNDYYSNFLSNLYNLQSDFAHSAWGNSNCGIIDIEYKSLHQVLYIFNGLSSFMWSRYAIHKIGFYNEFLHSVEDYDYLVRTYIHLDNKEIKYSKESGMKYYVNLPSSISVQDRPEHQNKRPVLNTFYREITTQEGVHKQKYFIYYSNTTWEKLFQRPHQIMRFMSNEYFKVFITSDNIFKYESKYQLWVIPYKFRHYILHLFNQLETHIYFTDSRLFDEVYYYKKQSNYKILYDLIDAPIEKFQVNIQKCIKNADHVIYSHSKLLKYLNDIDTNKGYHYISNICKNEMVTDKGVCNKIYEIIDKELSIVILCWNQLAYTKQCIESVLKNTKSNNYEIVVVNNGSTDGTYEYLNSLNKDNIKIINNSNNLGFSKGMNIGVKNSIGKYVILLNNDTWVSEGWDVALIDILKYKSNVYTVTPVTNLCGNKAMINIPHDNPNDYFNKFLKLKPKLLKKFYIDSLGLFCGAFRRIEFIQMGYLDETYLNGWEDDDFYEKIDIINKKVMVTTDSVVYHFGSITVGANNYSDANNKNKLYFEKKWDKKWKGHHINNIPYDNNQSDIQISYSITNEDNYNYNLKYLDQINTQVKNKVHQQFKPTIIVFSMIDYFFRIQRNQHISNILSQRGYQVFYLKTSLNQHKNAVYKISDNLYEVSLYCPTHINIYTSHLDIEQIKTLSRSIDDLKTEFNFNYFVSYITNPFWYQLVKYLKNTGIIFDCVDYTHGFNTHPEIILQEEQSLLKKEYIIFTSPILRKMVKHELNNYKYIRNGCDFKYFNNIEQNKTKNIKIIGYYGAISDWFDIELITETVKSLPECEFHFIGKIGCYNKNHEKKIKDLGNFENVTLFGEIPYKDLHKYVYKFDIGLIPFIINDLIKCTNPVKLYEMFAFGLPVVLTMLPDVLQLNINNLCYLSENSNQFIKNIKEIISKEEPETLINHRIEYSRNNTWEQRVDDVEAVINHISPGVSIVLLCWNNWKYTQRCIESVLKNSNYDNYELIIVNNCSQDETREELQFYNDMFEFIKVINNDKNYGFAKGMNIGSLHVKYDYIILLNNDTVVSKNWLYPLVKPLILNSNYTCGSPITNNCGNEAKQFIYFENIIDLFEKAEILQFNSLYKCVDASRVPFFSPVLRKNDFYSVGMLSEEYKVGGWEDDDLMEKLKKFNKNSINFFTYGSFVYHMESLSMNQTVSNNTSWTKQNNNKNIFEKKWEKKWVPHLYHLPTLKVRTDTKNMYINQLLQLKYQGSQIFEEDMNGMRLTNSYNYNGIQITEHDTYIIIIYKNRRFKLIKREYTCFKFYSILNTCINCL